MKKLLLLFAVLLTTVGAWAQEVVTYINVNNVYKLHCIASAHAAGTPQGKYLADDADGNILGRSDEGTYFCFEKADGENQYYIKNVKTGKYINAEARSNAPVTTSTDKAIATVWTLGVPAHTQSVVTFGLPGDFYLNNNGDAGSQYLKANSHNGGPAANNACSLWKLEDHGTLVTFVNVQKDGTKYALYINNGALDKTKLTGETTIESLGDNAKFVATKLANGKYTFYNVANKVYMIWRGKGGGHDGDNGVLGTYNSAYCDWEIVSSHGDGREGTMSLYGKRGNNSAGSLVLLSNGDFDAYGHTLGWADGYSNVFQIDNLAHFKYTFKHDGETKGTQESFIAPLGNVYPAPKTLPAYVTTNSIPVGVIDASTKEQSYDVAVEYNLPFEVSENFATAKWYYMNIRSNDKKWVAHSVNLPYSNRKQRYPDIYGQWAFMGNPFDGIQLLNKGAGASYTLGYDGTSTDSNIRMKDVPTTWTIEQGNGGFALHIGTTNQYLHDYNQSLKIWNDGNARGDVGSALQVEAVEEFTFHQLWGNHYPWTTEVLTELPDSVVDCQYHDDGLANIRMAQTNIVAKGGDITIDFAYSNGSHMLMIAGVDLVKDSVVVKQDYHEGSAGINPSGTAYTLSEVETGEYTLRYFVCEKKSGTNQHSLDATYGNITVNGAKRANVDVKYVFTLDGVEKEQSEPVSCVPGEEYPDIANVFPYGIYVTKPSGTIVDSDIVNGLVTKTIQMEERLPFYKSTSYEEATWYLLDMHCNDSGTGDVSDGTNRYVWTYVPESATNNVQLPKERSKQSTLFADNKLWCFIGNAYDGFKIYNKVAGASLTLNKNTDGNNVAQMSDGNNATSYILHTSQVNGAICFKPKGHDYYLNTQKNDNLGVKVLQGWNDNDGGSSCRFFTPTDFIEDAILAEFDPNIPACAVGTKKMLDRDVHALLSQTLSTIQADGWETSVITPELTNIIEGLSTSNDLYEIGTGYYLIKNTGDASNNQTWYLTHKKNNNQDCLWAMGISGTANADYIWKLEAVDGGYKMLCPNLGKYFQLKTATNGGDNNTYITSSSNDANTMHFEASGQTKFSIKNADNQNIRTEGDGQVNYWSGEPGEKWYLISATDMEIATTITEAGAATLYTSVPLNIPEGVTAKYVKAVDNEGSTGKLRYTKLDKTIPANTAVVLTGEADDYAFTVANDVEAVTDNVLFGYATETAATDNTGIYALANKTNGVAFYPFVGTTYKAGKAYLNISGLSASEVRFFNIFDEDMETAIEGVEGENGNVKTEIYDLAGRRVQNAQKGVFIVNGKVVIK